MENVIKKYDKIAVLINSQKDEEALKKEVENFGYEIGRKSNLYHALMEESSGTNRIEANSYIFITFNIYERNPKIVEVGWMPAGTELDIRNSTIFFNEYKYKILKLKELTQAQLELDL